MSEALAQAPFMFWVGVAVLAIPVLTRGSYRRLLLNWQWGSFLFAGFALQELTTWFDPPANGTHRIGFGILVASYVLTLAFTLRNAARTGMIVASIGIAANFLVIVVNEGMPVRVPPAWEVTGGATTTVKHHPETEADRLTGLGDIILLPGRETLISFGDLIFAAGLLSASFHASRARRRSATRNTRRSDRRRARVDPTSIDANETSAVEVSDTTAPDGEGGVDPHRRDRSDAWIAASGGIVEFVELDLTDTPPKPPSPIVAGVIAELDEMRRSARDRHPSAVFERRRGPFVGRFSPRQTASEGGDTDVDADIDIEQETLSDGSPERDLERLEHAPVVHISGAGIEGLQRRPSS